MPPVAYADWANDSLPFFWLGALLQGQARAARSGRPTTRHDRRGHPQRGAARGAACRRGGRQPGSGGQEPRAAAVAPAGPGRRDAAALGRGGADLQPGGPGHAVRRRGARAHAALRRAAGAGRRWPSPKSEAQAAPLVLVVDDSLTVRRVTQRLLAREGYRVDRSPRTAGGAGAPGRGAAAVVLSDIEMPRMDGFDLVRNMRADARLARCR